MPGVYQYKLATRDALDGDGTEWYLKRTDKPSSSTDLVTSLPAIAVPGTLWWAQLSDLRKRLGEVRYGAQDGLWARAITWEDESRGLSHNGFHQKVYGLNLGLDHIVRQDEKSMWLIGGNLKTFHAEQDIQTRAGGDGETDSWGLNLYATWADWDGYYARFRPVFRPLRPENAYHDDRLATRPGRLQHLRAGRFHRNRQDVFLHTGR